VCLAEKAGMKKILESKPNLAAFEAVEKLRCKLSRPDIFLELSPTRLIGADGGTQVKNLREVGQIELLKAENKRKHKRRVYFKFA